MALIEFSALSMPITAPGSEGVLRTLERLDGKAGELSKTIGKQLQNDLAGLQRLANTALKDMERGAAAGVREFREAAAAQREYMQSIGASDQQLLKLERTTEQFDRKLKQVERSGRSTGNALARMTSGIGVSEIIFSLERMAQGTDKITDAARGALRSLSAVTAMMGPGGIATSVVLGGIAAVMDYFDQLDKRIEESARKFREELAGMVRSGNLLGASSIAQTLYSGDVGAIVEGKRKGESDAEFLARSRGLQGLRAEAARLKPLAAAEDRARLAASAASENAAADIVAARAQGSTSARLDEINRLLAEQEARYKAVNSAIGSASDPNSLLGKSSDEAANRLNRLQEKEAAKRGPRRRGASIEELVPSVSYAQIAAAVVQDVPGGKLDAGASRLTRGILGDLSGELGKGISADIQQGIRAGVSSIGPAVSQLDKSITDPVKQLSKRLEESFQDSLVGAFQRGFSAGSIGGFIKGFGQSVLGMMGELFIEIGKKLINFGAIATAVANAIKSLGIFSGPAAIAAGVALVALGVGMGALGGGGGGGGGGRGSFAGGGSSSAPPMVIDRGLINPLNPLTSQSAARVQPQQAVQVINPVFLSPNDPTTQRLFVETIQKAAQRGSL